MRKLAVLATVAVSMAPTHAALIDNDTFTTDTETGPDWLDLSVTDGVSVFAAEEIEGWRVASNSEVEALFATTFDGFYTTGTYFNYTGGSRESDSAYGD